MSQSTTNSDKDRYVSVTDPSQDVWVSPMDSYAMGVEMAKKEDGGIHTSVYIILMGPTGSGKSSFIEAIASKSTKMPLGIAKDQLESVTQQPSLYEIMNLNRTGDKIYIMDTPGFADPRISELQVLDNVTFWRDRCQDCGYARILYFHPITDIRMPASRKRCLNMIHNFWGIRQSKRAMLVTSMWDRLPEWSRNTAERRFAELSKDHWGDWINVGSPVAKFENTFESSLEILNILCTPSSFPDFPKVKHLGMEGTTGNPVYEALLARISSVEQQRDTLREDLARPDSQDQAELMSILTTDLAKTELLLRQFNAEMEGLLTRLGPAAAAAAAAPHSEDVTGIDTMSTDDADPVLTLTMEPTTTRSKRFRAWVHKKVDKLHLHRSSQTGV